MESITQLNLFPEPTAPSSSLFGRQVHLSSPCNCGCSLVTVGSSKAMHEAAIHCNRCGRHRGWLSKQDAAALRTEIDCGKRPSIR
jgi:hypothetical protein